ILPSEMSKSAKTSKSLFNSFSRIHRLATLGAVCVAAWFSSQFIQKNSQIPIAMEEKLATPGSEETSMVQKAVPAPESLETSGTTPITTGEPSFDILWSLVIVLLVVVAGLIIELVIKNKKRETTKLS
ncbi:MAG: ArsR family transcriptional regulator, partial [Nitrososphaerales archaeon]